MNSAGLRPRRSLLYVPGANARAIEKVRSLACDGVILDLEDSVAPDGKDAARAQVVAALAAGGLGGREIIVRVNGLGSPWGAEDLAAIVPEAPDAILLPKVEDADDLREAAADVETLGAGSGMRLWAMMETPRAILAADAIARATPRLAGFVMGTNDLAKELHAAHVPGRAPLLASLSLVVLAARAHGLAVLDSVYADIRDGAGFEAECRQGAELGFDGKTLIHPSQIAIANRVFRPAPEAIAEARRILDAWREAEAAGRGVAVLDGRMIERLHVEEAERVLALEAAIERRTGDAAGA